MEIVNILFFIYRDETEIIFKTCQKCKPLIITKVFFILYIKCNLGNNNNVLSFDIYNKILMLQIIVEPQVPIHVAMGIK